MMKHKLTRVFRALFAVTFLALSSYACAVAKPPEVIDFQLRWHHQFQFAGYYAAVEKGFYKDEGLDVRLHEAAPGRTPVGEVLAGRAQYAESNAEILYARLQGQPLVALASIFQHSPSVLLVRKDSNITTPHDLIGKKVMLLNAQTDADFHAMLRHEGIKPDAIEIVPSSLDFEDFVSGKVAAFNSYLTNEPYILNQRGIEYNVINPSVYGIDFYSDILFTSEQELKMHPERVEAFRRATLKGWHYAMDNPAEIIDLLLFKYQVPKSREHLVFEAKTMRALILPDIVEIGHMNPGRWLRMAEAFSDVGMADKNFSLDGFIYDPNPHEVKKLQRTVVLVSLASGLSILVAVLFAFGWVRLRREIELRKLAEEEVRKLAYNDPLTGIANRNTFIPYASKQLLAAQRNDKKIALCFVDLNFFKNINDSYGHEAGDKILIQVAKALSSSIRGADMAARIGGDEFVVLLTDINDKEDSFRAITNIHQAIAQPLTFKDVDIVVTASIGVAIFPNDGVQIDELLSKADQAMFKDKIAHKVLNS